MADISCESILMKCDKLNQDDIHNKNIIMNVINDIDQSIKQNIDLGKEFLNQILMKLIKWSHVELFLSLLNDVGKELFQKYKLSPYILHTIVSSMNIGDIMIIFNYDIFIPPTMVHNYHIANALFPLMVEKYHSVELLCSVCEHCDDVLVKDLIQKYNVVPNLQCFLNAAENSSCNPNIISKIMKILEPFYPTFEPTDELLKLACKRGLNEWLQYVILNKRMLFDMSHLKMLIQSHYGINTNIIKYMVDYLVGTNNPIEIFQEVKQSHLLDVMEYMIMKNYVILTLDQLHDAFHDNFLSSIKIITQLMKTKIMDMLNANTLYHTEKENILMYTCQYNFFDILEILVSKYKVNIPTKYLVYFVNDLSKFQQILKYGITIDITTLEYVCSHRDPNMDVIKIILDHGVIPTSICIRDIIHNCAQANEIIKLFASYKCNIAKDDVILSIKKKHCICDLNYYGICFDNDIKQACLEHLVWPYPEMYTLDVLKYFCSKIDYHIKDFIQHNVFPDIECLRIFCKYQTSKSILKIMLKYVSPDMYCVLYSFEKSNYSGRSDADSLIKEYIKNNGDKYVEPDINYVKEFLTYSVYEIPQITKNLFEIYVKTNISQKTQNKKKINVKKAPVKKIQIKKI